MTAPAETAAAGTRIGQPEPGLTVEDFVQRAKDLRPHLRAEQQATEQRSCHSPETQQMFQDAGFYRMLQPKYFGGYELKAHEFLRVVTELARGCPNSGWCFSLGAAHVMPLATLFSAEVQAEAFGSSGHFVAPSRAVPSVSATPAEGGWLLDGVWDYCSGAPYSTHVLNSVRLPADEDGAPRIGAALVPREKYTVLDDWGDMLGLRGTGSNSVRVENAFVPSGYVLDVDMADVRLQDTVGVQLHGNPMFTGRLQGLFFTELLAIGVGIARAMLDEYAEALPVKRPFWSPQSPRSADPLYQQWYGEATALIDLGAAAVQRAGEVYHELCERQVAGGAPFSKADDLRLTGLAQQGARPLEEAVDLLFRTAGSSALRDGSRTQRYWRDFGAFRTHAAATLREFVAAGFTVTSGLADKEKAR